MISILTFSLNFAFLALEVVQHDLKIAVIDAVNYLI